jgi:uncharacterized protein YdaU (DUF1376 family)
VPKERVPAFQFYPKDFLTDSNVVRMSNTEVGIYMRLLCYCWLDGDLPLETEALASMARMPLKQFTKLWENSIVKTCFHLGEDGRLHQKRLDEERTKQDEFRRRQSDNGRLGGRPAKPTDKPDTKTQENPSLLETEPKKSSPISDLRSAFPSPKLPEARVASSDDDLGDRARELLEHYPRWYAEERHGARIALLGGPIQFAEAQKLCEVWDDGRLEKLARLVLSTDDDWISRTDRGWKIFVLKASWADNALRQWEQANGIQVPA